MVKSEKPQSTNSAFEESEPPFYIIKDFRKSLKLKKERERRKLKQLKEKKMIKEI